MLKKESMFKALKNLSVVTGAISIAFILSIALIMSGLNELTSVGVSLGIAVLYLVYRAITIDAEFRR